MDHVLKELDALLHTQAQLMFAQGNYNEGQATAYGVALLDFMRLHGVEVREAVRLACYGDL